MVSVDRVANVLAMLASFIAMISLAVISPKIGGGVGKMFKLLIVGIFLSVLAHSALELSASYGYLREALLMQLMGGLLTLGSIFFIIAAYVGYKTFK